MKRLSLVFAMLVVLSMAFALTCYDIQYTQAGGTYPSPYAGQTVTVEGVVTCNTFGTTSTNNNPKFMISDPEGGPWHGLYIYRFGTGVQIGDWVSVTGPVSEYQGLTEIGGTGTTVTIISHNYPLPAPSLIQTGWLAYPVTPAIAEMVEPYESVLCRVDNVTVEVAPNTYQEFYVNDGSGQGQIDDYGMQYPHTWTGITVGQHFDRIVGIVDYYNSYGLNPRTDADVMVTSNEDFVVLPDVSLIGNYPNPFAQNTEIAFNLKSAQNVNLEVYNLKGQKVRSLVRENLKAQLHNVTFDGRDDQGKILPAGIYMYKLSAGNTVQSRKLVIR